MVVVVVLVVVVTAMGWDDVRQSRDGGHMTGSIQLQLHLHLHTHTHPQYRHSHVLVPLTAYYGSSHCD